MRSVTDLQGDEFVEQFVAIRGEIANHTSGIEQRPVR